MKIQETVINIVFDAGKGRTPVQSREGILGQPFGALPKPSRAGYSFDGWFMDGEPVTGETVIRSDRDVVLVAGWKKKEVGRRATMLRRQKLVCIVLAAVIVLLGVSCAVANNIVGIYTLKDTYTDEDGVEHTIKYKIKKDKDGLYTVYNKDGTALEVVEDNGFNNYTSSYDKVQYLVYETESGNQYRLNTSTGEYETYAVVDTEGDEVLGGTVVSTRVMMFPRITQANTYSITVNNRYGEYEIYRKTIPNSAYDASKQDGTKPYTSAVTVRTNGVDSAASYNPELYASLCVSCGYSLTMSKLDLSDPEAPRKEDGSIDYACYGLEICTDGEGTVDYEKSPAVYTIRSGGTMADGSYVAQETEYTVYIGSAIVSGGGYYAKRADWDAVYIVSSDIATTVLQPVEKLVTPLLVYPMTMVTYSMVENFFFASVDEGGLSALIASDSNESLSGIIHPITEFSYISLEERENTIYSTTPYVIPEGSTTKLMNGYQINSNNVSTVLYSLYSTDFLGCKKLSPALEDFDTYGFNDRIWYLSFNYDPDIANGGSGTYVTSLLLISRKTYDESFGQDVYYVWSMLYDMIVAVDPYYFSFVEWEQSSWYNSSFFQNNIAFIREIHYEIGDKTYDFILDNSESDQADSITSSNMKIYFEQYNGNEEHLLDYTITETTVTDAGKTKIKEYSATDNFRRLYARLLWYTIEGDVSAAEFRKSTGMSVEEFIQSDTDDDKWIARITYRVEDYATIANTYLKEDNTPLYTENNSFDAVLRFYEYGSGRKLLLTIEVVDTYDENGNPVFDATDAQGNFYVLPTMLGDIVTCAEKVLAGELCSSMT